MTVMERKARVIQTILNHADENMLADIEIILHAEITRQPPCQYTIEEVKEGIRKSMEDVKAGRVISFEEFEKEYENYPD
jgi:hypothetical protein